MAEERSSVERVGDVTPVEEERILTPAQMQCLTHIRKWVESEAEFYGRTDNEFLYMFLFGCKFNVETIKKKMCKYYDNRRKLPHWWANRDLKDPELLPILDRKISIMLKDCGPNHPLIYIVKLSRLDGAMGPGALDAWLKLTGINFDIALRRTATQMVGAHVIVDAAQVPLWLISRLMSPKLIKDLLTSFILAAPLRLKSVVVVNCPLIGNAVWSIVRPLLSQKIKDRVHIYRSNWTELFDYLDRAYIPEEYGGNAGPLTLHEEVYLKELLSYTEFILEDNQYGYQKKDQY